MGEIAEPGEEIEEGECEPIELPAEVPAEPEPVPA